MNTDGEPTRPDFRALVTRAVRLRCPVCGQAPMFQGLFRMAPRCTACGFQYEREPGYFLGSIYFSYGAIGLITMVALLVLQFVLHWDIVGILATLSVFIVACTVLGFRHARAFWLALDLTFDPPKSSDYPEP